MGKTIIILDLEATCQKERDASFTNEIIEIGAVKIVGGKKVGEFTRFIKPIVNPVLTEFCKALTTITQEEIDSAKGFELALIDFLKWVGPEETMYMSWGAYDKNQFIKDCNLNKVSSAWLKRHVNLKQVYFDKVLPKIGVTKERRPVGMAKALMYSKIPLEGTHHRGIDDARNIAQIYLKHPDLWDN